jgi:hypothetical protein
VIDMRTVFPLLLPSLALGACLTLGCTSGEAATSRGKFTVDTLADGTPRTMTELPVGWSDTNGWKLVEVARLTGGTESEGDLLDPQDVTMDAAGRIYVSENDPALIKQYAPDGTFLRTIGRSGQGPGEFRTAFLAAAGGHLYVHDPRASRTSLFDTTGTFIRSWPSFCCFWMPISVDSAGNVQLQGQPPSTAVQDDKNPWTRTVRWYGPDSVVADTALVPTGPEEKRWVIKSGKNNVMSTVVPFAPGTEFIFLPDHRMVTGFGDNYLLAITRNNGTDTTALFGRSWSPLPVPDEMRKATVEARIQQTKEYYDETVVRNAFQLSEVPNAAPAFDWVGVDGEGNLWVRTPIPTDSTRTLFDIFDREHRWLGQVSGSKYLRSWSAYLLGGHMVGVGEDEEGNPVVIVYRIERGGGS